MTSPYKQDITQLSYDNYQLQFSENKRPSLTPTDNQSQFYQNNKLNQPLSQIPTNVLNQYTPSPIKNQSICNLKQQLQLQDYKQTATTIDNTLQFQEQITPLKNFQFTPPKRHAILQKSFSGYKQSPAKSNNQNQYKKEQQQDDDQVSFKNINNNNNNEFINTQNNNINNNNGDCSSINKDIIGNPSSLENVAMMGNEFEQVINQLELMQDELMQWKTKCNLIKTINKNQPARMNSANKVTDFKQARNNSTNNLHSETKQQKDIFQQVQQQIQTSQQLDKRQVQYDPQLQQQQLHYQQQQQQYNNQQQQIYQTTSNEKPPLASVLEKNSSQKTIQTEGNYFNSTNISVETRKNSSDLEQKVKFSKFEIQRLNGIIDDKRIEVDQYKQYADEIQKKLEKANQDLATQEKQLMENNILIDELKMAIRQQNQIEQLNFQLMQDKTEIISELENCKNQYQLLSIQMQNQLLSINKLKDNILVAQNLQLHEKYQSQQKHQQQDNQSNQQSEGKIIDLNSIINQILDKFICLKNELEQNSKQNQQIIMKNQDLNDQISLQSLQIQEWDRKYKEQIESQEQSQKLYEENFKKQKQQLERDYSLKLEQEIRKNTKPLLEINKNFEYQNSELQNRIVQFEQSLTQEKDHNSQLQDVIQKKEYEINLMQTDLKRLEENSVKQKLEKDKEIKVMIEKNEQTESKLNKANESIQDQQNTINQIQGNLSEFIQKNEMLIKQVEKDKYILQKIESDYTSRIKKIELEYEETKQNTYRLLEQQENMEKALQSATQEIQELSYSNEQSKNKIIMQLEQIKELEMQRETLNEKCVELDGYKSKYRELKEEILIMQHQFDDYKNNLLNEFQLKFSKKSLLFENQLERLRGKFVAEESMDSLFTQSKISTNILKQMETAYSKMNNIDNIYQNISQRNTQQSEFDKQQQLFKETKRDLSQNFQECQTILVTPNKQNIENDQINNNSNQQITSEKLQQQQQQQIYYEQQPQQSNYVNQEQNDNNNNQIEQQQYNFRLNELIDLKAKYEKALQKIQNNSNNYKLNASETDC